MPEVSLDTKNQCTLDDPTDGADLPSAVPSVRTPNEVPTAAPVPLCLAHEPGSGGATSDCTDELVRQFGGAQGAGPFAPTPLAEKASCSAETLSFVGACGKVLYELAEERKIDPFNVASCAGSISSLTHCEFKGD